MGRLSPSRLAKRNVTPRPKAEKGQKRSPSARTRSIRGAKRVEQNRPSRETR